MKNVTINIRSTDVKSFKYENNFSAKPGAQIKMQIKNGMNIRFNPNTPTEAVVFVKFEANDQNGAIKFELETVTPVSVNTFIDNIDEVIKKHFMPNIMMAVNEKVRTYATLVGLNINAPMVSFPYNGDDDNDGGSSLDDQIFKNF